MIAKGKLSQAVGKRFEDNCNTMHEEYMLRKLGFFWKNEIGSRVIWTSQGMKSQPLPSRPDFSGILSSGRFVTFDAKSTANKNKWSLSKESLHQVAHMQRLSEYGALTFFLLESRVLRVCYIIRVTSQNDTRPAVIFATAMKDPNVVPFIIPEDGRIDWLHVLAEAGKVPDHYSLGW